MVERIAWYEPPRVVRDAIQVVTGPALRTKQVETGHSCLLGMVVPSTPWTVRADALGVGRRCEIAL